MKNKNFTLVFLIIISFSLIIAIFVSFNSFNRKSYAISYGIDPSTWSYVDGLGRTGSTNVTKSNKTRLVGMFYWTWHSGNNGPGPFNVTNIVNSNLDRINDCEWWNTNYKANSYWWNEPVYGYYLEHDDYVLRKQAELLADAGVDFVVFDCTNGTHSWQSAYENLLKVWLEAFNAGINVPKVAFMFPFAYSSTTTGVSFMDIYNNLYNPSSANYQKYHDLLFNYNGKPFVLMAGYKNASTEIKNILQNFEVRENVASYFTTGAKSNGSWGWLSTYPQAYYKKANGEPEQISVGVSMNANYVNNTLAAMNGTNVMGRSYAQGDYSYSYNIVIKLLMLVVVSLEVVQSLLILHYMVEIFNSNGIMH